MEDIPVVQDPPKERRFSWCPCCTDVRGAVVAVTCKDSLKTLTYRCPHCQSIWMIDNLDRAPLRFFSRESATG